MKMHKFSSVAALVLGSLLVCTVISSAEDANSNTNGNAPAKRERPRPPSVEQRVERMSTDLKLSDEQKAKVTALFEEDSKKMRELRSDKNLTRDEQREKFRAMRSESNTKLKQILTPEQWEKQQQRMHAARAAATNGEKKSDGTKNGGTKSE